MKKAKPKLTRQDAERLFAGLPGAGLSSGTGRSSASKPVNPFGPSPMATNSLAPVQRPDDESRLWKDNLITLPIAVELPAGYATVSQVHAAIVRAWRVRWVREAGHEVVTEFPEGWKAVRPPTGPIELRDPSNAVRAVYGWSEDAEVRILTRYQLETQSNSSSGMGSLLIRDRATGKILERSSIWSAMTGTQHPEWPRLSGWLAQHFPQHRDPFRYWDDCEAGAAEAGQPA